MSKRPVKTVLSPPKLSEKHNPIFSGLEEVFGPSELTRTEVYETPEQRQKRQMEEAKARGDAKREANAEARRQKEEEKRRKLEQQQEENPFLTSAAAASPDNSAEDLLLLPPIEFKTTRLSQFFKGLEDQEGRETR